MNSTTYWWQGAYECAVLETDPARMATLIDDALYAIEQRVGGVHERLGLSTAFKRLCCWVGLTGDLGFGGVA
jgi:hypothetical protein